MASTKQVRISNDLEKVSRNSSRGSSRNHKNLGSFDEDEEFEETNMLNQSLSTKQETMIKEEEEEDEEEEEHKFGLQSQSFVGIDFLERMRNIHKIALEGTGVAEEGKRTAMGEYVPPEGKQALTQLALPTPGPTDYQPKLTISKPSAPQYSIVGKAKNLTAPESPGPNNYNTQGDLVWKDRKITLKGKGKMAGVKFEGDCDLAAAYYDVTYGSIGTRDKSKYTMGLKGRLRNGPPNRLVHPVDTFGFNTPGPAEYKPNPSYWGVHGAKTSFGLLLHKKENRRSPGPGEYNIERDKTNGPSYSFRGRLGSPPVTGDCAPGPGSYKIGTTIGKSLAKSITGRQNIKKKDVVPSPNTYSLPSSIGKGPKNQMTYRAFETAVDATPGPTEYTPGNENLPKGPKFTCGILCRPGILHHLSEYAVTQNPDVGPNTYYPNPGISKNDKPAYSIATRFKQKIEITPGPTTYDVKQTTRQGHSKAPAFSIGKRIEENPENLSPGPAAYNPKPNHSTTTCSISGWNRKGQEKQSNLPAANAYAVQSGQTRKGKCNGPAATLKGRPSPFVYSGFSRTINT